MNRTTFFSALVMILLVSLLSAQGCPPGQVFLKNDNLPAVPGGATAVSVIQGLCEGEACGAVFDVTAIGQSVAIDMAAVGLFNVAGANGITAVVNLQIYDGVTFSGALATLGPQVFDFTNAANASISISSHAINTQDISSFNVSVNSGKLVVVWVMDFNPLGGTCPAGYQTNFGTDNPSFSFTCNSPLQKNLIYIDGQGWRDAALANVSGIQLCPLFYNGSWVIRACVRNANPRVITFFPSANIFPGQFAIANFQADGAEAGLIYIPVISCAIGSTNIPSTTFNIPVLSDVCTSLYFNDPAVHQIFALTPLPSYFGTLSPTANATGLISIPNWVVAPPGGLPIYMCFAVADSSGIIAVSNRATLTIN